MDDEHSSEKPVACRNEQCGRALARQVGFCPYCGAAQGDTAISAELPATALEESSTRTDTGEGRQDASAGGTTQSEACNGDRTGSTAPTSTGQAEPSAVEPETDAVDVPEQPEQKPAPAQPRMGRVLLAGIAALIAATIYVLLPGARGPQKVQVDASTRSWKSVDLSGFTNGHKILIRADGPFRLRSHTTAPVLVNGVNSIVLGALGQSDLQVKAAGGQPVHIEIADAGG